ncbi:FAD-binding protein [Neisseria sp. Ec49-e6-T10]|uniref:FAD-binding protein n=1 Tax=Neisseria sp. Ec49-e6-T10 TaxID=3140744 RepID=UPI003EBB1C7D
MNQYIKYFHVLLSALIFSQHLFATPIISNDITQMNPVQIQQISQPTSTKQVIDLVQSHAGPISIAGGKYSMGGQTTTEQALQIDIKKMNHIISFDPNKKEITVETGMTWRQIQEFIDPYDLSIKIMQSFANFTVGGSLSVNVHGRYVGEGPIILSVKQIKIVLADGSLITASPTENKEIFYGAIGGYGALGIITEATLLLENNVKIERISKLMPIDHYKDYFDQHIKNNQQAIFHNGVIYPPEYRKVRAVTYAQTDKPLTNTERLTPIQPNYQKQEKQIRFVAKSKIGKQLRKSHDFFSHQKPLVQWRNLEASLDVAELGPISNEHSSFVLQEYFIPVAQFDEFYPQLVEIIKKHKINIINISIRHTNKDSGSLMAWAKDEMFAFVIYYQQGTTQQDKLAVQQWTQELIEATLSLQGSYYLPYQPHATLEQFNQAYPNAQSFLKLKQQVDPTNKFRNKLWDLYLQ